MLIPICWDADIGYHISEESLDSIWLNPLKICSPYMQCSSQCLKCLRTERLRTEHIVAECKVWWCEQALLLMCKGRLHIFWEPKTTKFTFLKHNWKASSRIYSQRFKLLGVSEKICRGWRKLDRNKVPIVQKPYWRYSHFGGGRWR